MKDYAAIANGYAKDVVAGKIPNCRWAILACKRHLKDLERSKTKDYPYVFDAKKAAAICAFAEQMHHVKGKWAKKRERIVLQPWQVFILAVLFGWIWKATRLRRFRKAYVKIPRKNGKSVIAAIIGLYMWAMDEEHGAEVYSGATTEKQAWEVFRPAKQMLQKNEDLQEHTGAEIFAKSLVTLEDESRFEPVIGNPGDGPSPHCAIADEFHEHETSNLVDTMETGMGARDQPLLLEITTAGYNIAGPCYDQEIECRRVLQEVIEQDELFVMIFGIDEAMGDDPGDDWTDPKILRKANPNYDVSVSGQFLQAQQRQAVLNPIHQNKFKTKHLNVWCSAKIAWMSLNLWQLAGDPGLTIDDFKGHSCWGILDLASKDDLAVFGQIFKKKIRGADHYYAFARYYLPEDTVNEEGPNRDVYRKWHKQGLLTVTDGAEIDFDVIKSDILAYKSRFAFKEFAYDPWRATQLAQELRKESYGIEWVEFRQTVQNMSAPMKEVYAAVKGGRFHHDGNPVTQWMVSNVVAKIDAKDNIYPRKEKKEMKIDGAVTIIMGVARALGGSAANINDFLKDPVQ